MAKIEFVDVTKDYTGATKPAVDHVSFTVADGAMCMLLGTSGSGKTTLLRMVNRLSDPTSGQILINGTATTAQDPITLRRSIGYVIQQIGLFPHLTIAENVRVVPSILGQSAQQTAGRVDELLSLVGLEPAEYRARYPRQLSGGQQQRVGLARALAADPDVMLMDEPFGALDAITREHMQDELLRIHRETRKTIIFVTHDVNEALKLGDQIAVLSDGKLLQIGAPTDLLLHPVNDFVARLLGADNIVHLYENIPVSSIVEPLTAAATDHIDANTSLLQAMVQLVQSGQSALAVDQNDTTLGQVTLAHISRQLGMVQHAPTPTAQASVGASTK